MTEEKDKYSGLDCHQRKALEDEIKTLKARLQALEEIDKNDQEFSWAMQTIRSHNDDGFPDCGRSMCQIALRILGGERGILNQSN